MWLRCRAIPTAPLCFRKGGWGQWVDGTASEVFWQKYICGFDNRHLIRPPIPHPFLVQIFLDRCWGGIWPQYADTSISLSGKKFQTRNSDAAPTVSFQGVFRRSFQSLSWHLRLTNSQDHIKPLARQLAHQAQTQVSTWALSLKDSSVHSPFPAVNLRVLLLLVFRLVLKSEINRKEFYE